MSLTEFQIFAKNHSHKSEKQMKNALWHKLKRLKSELSQCAFVSVIVSIEECCGAATKQTLSWHSLHGSE